MYSFGGFPGDVPVVGDWNGDGRTKTAIVRHGQWTLDVNATSRVDAPEPERDSVVLWAPKPGDVPIVWSRR